MGVTHICALHSNGAVLCRSAASAASAGMGQEHLHLGRQAERYLAIAAAAHFTCGISAGQVRPGAAVLIGRGLLHCEGGNARLRPAFDRKASVWADTPVASIALSSNAGCAIVAISHSLVCFGSGVPSLESAMPSSSAFSAVAVGDGGDACAIRAGDGFLVCWGPQWAGGSRTYAEAYESVAIGRQWMCAVKRAGLQLQCYGLVVPSLFSSYNSLPRGGVVELVAQGDKLCTTSTGSSARVTCFGLSRNSVAALSTVEHQRLHAGLYTVPPQAS